MTAPSILRHLRELDREGYFATLFLAEDKREAVAALWAFNAEIERIKDLVSEPLPGEIRLQWWRDVIAGDRDEQGRQHPVGAALLDAIDKHALPRTALDTLCEARIFDLYNDPMITQPDLEGYLGETRSVLFQLAAQILGNIAPQNGDAAGHAGVAFGIAGLLRSLAADRARRQLFVPRDMLTATGLTVEQFLALKDPGDAVPAIAAFAALGREHLAKANAAIGDLPRVQRAAFIRLGTCSEIFDLAVKRGGVTAVKPLTISPIKSHWLMFRASMKYA